MDLVGRKLALDGGTLTQRFFALIRAELDAALPTAGEGLVAPVAHALARLERVTQRLAGSGGGAELGAAATDHLRPFALVPRSEDRPVGKEWCIQFRSRGGP